MPVKPNLEKEKIEQLLKAKKLSQIRALMTSHHPVDLADLLDELTLEEAVALFEQLPVDVASEVLDEPCGFASWPALSWGFIHGKAIPFRRRA